MNDKNDLYVNFFRSLNKSTALRFSTLTPGRERDETLHATCFRVIHWIRILQIMQYVPTKGISYPNPVAVFATSTCC